MNVLLAFLVPAEARRGGCWILWNLGYRWLSAIMWVLGIEPTSSGRTATAFNLWAISPTLFSFFFFQTFCCLSYLNEYLSWGHFASDNKSIHSSHLKWQLNTDVPVLCKLGSFFFLLKFPTLFKGALLFHVMNTVCFNFISRILRLSIWIPYTALCLGRRMSTWSQCWKMTFCFSLVRWTFFICFSWPQTACYTKRKRSALWKRMLIIPISAPSDFSAFHCFTWLIKW